MGRKLTKVTIACVLSMLFTMSFCFATTSSINVIVNNNTVTWSDAVPFIDNNNRTLVPIRAVCEAYGCLASWDNDSRQAVIKKGNVTVNIPIGEKYISINGNESSLDSAACIVNGRTYLPLRAVLEAFGADVSWNQNTRTITVTDRNSINNITDKDNNPNTDVSPSKYKTYPGFTKIIDFGAFCNIPCVLQEGNSYMYNASDFMDEGDYLLDYWKALIDEEFLQVGEYPGYGGTSAPIFVNASEGEQLITSLQNFDGDYFLVIMVDYYKR